MGYRALSPDLLQVGVPPREPLEPACDPAPPADPTITPSGFGVSSASSKARVSEK